MWQEEWPQKVEDLFNEGTLTIKNLDMTETVLNCLALECLTYNI